MNKEDKLLKGGEDNFYSDLLDKAQSLTSFDTDVDADDILEKRNEVIFELENNTQHSPKNAELTTTDRIIFIAVSYIMRSIALYIVEWGISTQMVVRFQMAFVFYFAVYMTLFLMLVILVNTSNQLYFRLLFYYVSFDNGLGRNALHIFIQVLLLPIPFLLNENPDDKTNGLQEEVTSFQKRRALMHSIENFSLFIWIFLSFIATVF